jgi:hypothetical protein
VQGVVVRGLLMLVLLAAGSVLWTAGQLERRLAAGHKGLATLQYAAPADGYRDVERSLRYVGRLTSAGKTLEADAHEQRAASRYWLGQYVALAPGRDSSGALTEHDGDVLLLAANAAYHASQAHGGDRQATIRALEDVMKRYVDVLKNSSGHTDAAYNYELVVRKRNLLAQPRLASTIKPDAPATIHGRPGGPPKDSDFAQFKIVIPRRSEEREDPDAGKGGQKIRKG